MQPFSRDAPAGELSAADPPAAAAGIWRGLDASANRAAEAIRVLEDALRFGLDDGHLAGVAKSIRHDLALVLARPELQRRIRCRDVPGDVGVGITPSRTPPRASLADLVAANASRGTQALRSLEEGTRLVAAAATPDFEALRYRLYTLERAAAAAVGSRGQLEQVRLCVLVSAGAPDEAFGKLLDGLLAAGVGMIQLRDKTAGVSLLCRRATQAVTATRRQAEACGGPRCLVIVNDRADIALAAGADGVHLGAEDLPVPLARRVGGGRLLIGRTAHSLAEARQAVLDGADYLGVGPCFESATKSFDRFAPEGLLRQVAAEISLPVFAIGGVTLERLERLKSLGLRRVAVAAAVTAADDPVAAARAFSRCLTMPRQSADQAG